MKNATELIEEEERDRKKAEKRRAKKKVLLLFFNFIRSQRYKFITLWDILLKLASLWLILIPIEF